MNIAQIKKFYTKKYLCGYLIVFFYCLNKSYCTGKKSVEKKLTSST